MQPKISAEEGQGVTNGAFVVLLASDDYFLGVKVLYWSLKSVKTTYPLVVLYPTDSISAVHIQELEALGCLVTETTRIHLDVEKEQYAQANYTEVWTKLRVFNLTEYSRVILLDADMLVRQNVDELMSMELPEGWIAACSGCLCNPMKVPTYPVDWIPENCPYTYEGQGEGNKSKSTGALAYLNSGLIVLKPSQDEFTNILNELKRDDCLDQYVFPEQDFLNKFYAGRWICLPYTYNALRPLSKSHPSMWSDNNVRIVHYIFKKPWLDEEWKAMSEEERRKHEFYTINSWWFQAYEKAQIEFS